jgi:hypothetical protein
MSVGTATNGSNDNAKKSPSAVLVVCVLIGVVVVVVVVGIVVFRGKASDDVAADVGGRVTVVIATKENFTLVTAQANEGDQEIRSLQLTSNPQNGMEVISPSSRPAPIQLTANPLYGVGGSATQTEPYDGVIEMGSHSNLTTTSKGYYASEAPPQPFYTTIDENDNFC